MADSSNRSDDPDPSVDPQPNSGATRREFLRGRSAADALRRQTESLAEGLSSAEKGVESGQQLQPQRESNYLEQYSKNAMACEFELLFNLQQYSQSGAVAMESFQMIDLLEDQMTVYRDHSEVSRMNRAAHRGPVRVEEGLFELLSIARSIFVETGGAFDVTASPLTRVWGFDRRQGTIPVQHQIDEVMKCVGYDLVQLDPSSSSVQFERQGVGIDLGGIGKGYALDQVANLIEQRGIQDFMIHGGQSSVLARGRSIGATVSHPGGQPNWTVGISHPTVPGVRLAEIDLVNQALGTSGTGRQGFFHQGQRYGHIIDPRSGWPASHFLSTTVVTKSAAVSDALATAFFVMPLESVEQYCLDHPEVSALLVSKSESPQGPLEIHTFNLEPNQWRRLN